MRLASPTKIEWLVIGAVFAVLVVLLIPNPKSVWDGEFVLTIHVNENLPIEKDSLLFAAIWFEDDAQRALKNPGVYDFGFRRPDLSDDGQALISVPATGRLATAGTAGTYNHPKFLVVEYQLKHDYNGTRKRKSFGIPSGRGKRSITIELQ